MDEDTLEDLWRDY